MYDEVYEAMVGSGVAIKLDEEVHVDELGCIVSDENGFGRKTKYLVT
jgi:phage gp36-like protein